jgi:hypothetical protein
VRTSERHVVGYNQSWTKGSPMGARKPPRAGCGTPSITTRGTSSLMYADGARMTSFSACRPYGSRVASPAFTPMAGGAYERHSAPAAPSRGA